MEVDWAVLFVVLEAVLPHPVELFFEVSQFVVFFAEVSFDEFHVGWPLYDFVVVVVECSSDWE